MSENSNFFGHCLKDQVLVFTRSNCEIRRHTALGEAEIGMFSTALDTCTPITIDECAQARGMAEQCLIQHDYTAYSDPDEALAVYAQYSACRLASKVDSCQ